MRSHVCRAPTKNSILAVQVNVSQCHGSKARRPPPSSLPLTGGNRRPGVHPFCNWRIRVDQPGGLHSVPSGGHDR